MPLLQAAAGLEEEGGEGFAPFSPELQRALAQLIGSLDQEEAKAAAEARVLKAMETQMGSERWAQLRGQVRDILKSLEAAYAEFDLIRRDPVHRPDNAEIRTQTWADLARLILGAPNPFTGLSIDLPPSAQKKLGTGLEEGDSGSGLPSEAAAVQRIPVRGTEDRLVIFTPATAATGLEVLAGLESPSEKPLQVAFVVEDSAQEAQVRAGLEQAGLAAAEIVNVSVTGQTVWDAVADLQFWAWSRTKQLETFVVDTLERFWDLGRWLKVPRITWQALLERVGWVSTATQA